MCGVCRSTTTKREHVIHDFEVILKIIIFESKSKSGKGKFGIKGKINEKRKKQFYEKCIKKTL